MAETPGAPSLNRSLIQGWDSTNPNEPGLLRISWKGRPTADFYIVRYGIKPNRLTLNYQVYDGESVSIPGLNIRSEYFFTVDAVNDTGIAPGIGVELVKGAN
jgi:hypothetical protein